MFCVSASRWSFHIILDSLHVLHQHARIFHFRLYHNFRNYYFCFLSFFFFSFFLDGNEESGVVHNCNMLCDQQPCQNEGACLEDFRSNTFHCDCEMTSYSGPYCTEGIQLWCFLKLVNSVGISKYDHVL